MTNNAKIHSLAHFKFMHWTDFMNGTGGIAPVYWDLERFIVLNFDMENGRFESYPVSRSVHRAVPPSPALYPRTHFASMKRDSGPKNGDQSFPTNSALDDVP